MLNEVTLGLDLGTGGVRVVAIDRHHRVIAQTTRPYPLLTPHPGWTEQQPADWVATSLAALSDVAAQLQHSNLQRSDIVALGLSGQMHGMVALAADGTVVRPAILWNDQRTAAAVAEIEAAIPRQTLIQRTGNPAITGFQLPKLIWLRSAEPDAFAQTQHILLPKDYLGYVLTGERVTEPSDASGVGCLNLHSRQWDTDILQALQVPPRLFPPIADSTAIVGRLSVDVAARTGLPPGLPVVAGGGDNAAAAIGLGISSARLHQGSLSIGTSGVIFAPLQQPTPDPEGRAHLFCHADGGYHLLGVTLAAGGALRWYRDTIAPQTSYEQLMALAETSPPGARGVLFLPHLAGERTPYLDAAARAAWVNLSLAHSQADLVRALLEGVALSLRAAQEVVTAITALDRLVATGGGSRSPLWSRILADILNVELALPETEEGAAYGAALLAWVGCGAYPTVQAMLDELPEAASAVQPAPQPLYDQAFDRFKTLYVALQTAR